MSDDLNATDVAAASMNAATDVATVANGNPAVADANVAADTAKPGTVDPNNLRDGLSRSQKRELTAAQTDKLLDFVETHATEAQKAEIAQKFEATEVLQGVDDETKKTVKDNFDKEYNELVELGVAPEKAFEKATQLATSAIPSDQQVRAEGRTRATIPPTSTQTAQRSVYNESELLQMAPQQAADIRKMEQSGQVSITQDVQF